MFLFIVTSRSSKTDLVSLFFFVPFRRSNRSPPWDSFVSLTSSRPYFEWWLNTAVAEQKLTLKNYLMIAMKTRVCQSNIAPVPLIILLEADKSRDFCARDNARALPMDNKKTLTLTLIKKYRVDHLVVRYCLST